MKLRTFIKKRFGLALIFIGYAVSILWVFTRSDPIIQKRPVTISLAHWQLERGPSAGIAAIIKRYEELNPRVHVEQQMVPDAVWKQWMRSNLAGGTGSDIMEWGMWLAGQKDIPARYFEPLTAELKQPNPYNKGTALEGTPWEKTFHDGLIGPRRDSPDPGQIYAVTFTEVSTRLFCNIALLREITGSDRAPKSFDDLRKIFEKVHAYAQRTGKRVNSLAGSRDNGIWIAQNVFSGPLLKVNYSIDESGYLYLYNRQVLAAYLDGKWRYNQPGVKAGLQLIREVADAMKPGFLQLRRDDAMLEFFSGEAVFLYTGTWDATSLRQMASFEIVPMRLPPVTPDDPEVGPLIKGVGGEGQGETAMAMYLNKSSAHKAEALDFLRFATSVEGQQLFTDASLWLPAINGVKLPEPIKSFRDYQDGYALGQAPYDVIGSEVSMTWLRNFYQLSGAQGSPERFATVLDEAMPAAIRKDLQDEMRNTLLLVKPADTQIVAYAELAGETPEGRKAATRQTETEAGQTMSEGLAFQMKEQLERTAIGK